MVFIGNFHNHVREKDLTFGKYVEGVNLAFSEFEFTNKVIGQTNYVRLDGKVLPYYDNLIANRGNSFEYRDLGNALYVLNHNLVICKGYELELEYEGKLKEIVVLGLKSLPKPLPKKLIPAIKIFKDEGGILIAPHPAIKRGLMDVFDDHSDLVHSFAGIETHNSSLNAFGFLSKPNDRAKKYYYELTSYFPLKVGACISTDARRLSDLGKDYVLYRSELDFKDTGHFRDSLENAIQYHMPSIYDKIS